MATSLGEDRARTFCESPRTTTTQSIPNTQEHTARLVKVRPITRRKSNTSMLFRVAAPSRDSPSQIPKFSSHYLMPALWVRILFTSKKPASLGLSFKASSMFFNASGYFF